MRLSPRTQHAMLAMMVLALHERDEHMPRTRAVTLATLSKQIGISASYLEQLFRDLRGHELVIGARGPSGGYQLRKAATDISLADIASAVERTTSKRLQGISRELWNGLDGRLSSSLGDISLADATATAASRSSSPEAA